MMRLLLAEGYKMKHTGLARMHILLPAIYALSFFVAVETTGLRYADPSEIVSLFWILLGGAFPPVIGIVTAKASSMEEEAGKFQSMLTLPRSRSAIYLAKLIVLLAGAALSLGIAVALFASLSGLQSEKAWFFQAVVVFSGSVILYEIHLPLAAIFGGGASLGLGWIESLISLLFLTGLGDGRWYYVPAAWSMRLALSFIESVRRAENAFFYAEISALSRVALSASLAVLLLSLYGFSRWDGSRFGE